MNDVDVDAPVVPRRRAVAAGLGAVAVAVWGFVAWPIASAWVAHAQVVPVTAVAAEAQVGDCFVFQDDAAGLVVASQAPGVTSVACAQAHDGQFYASGELDVADFPGEDALGDEVIARCSATELLESLSADAAALEVQAFFPSESSWDAGDRAWACAVVAEVPFTGTMLAE